MRCAIKLAPEILEGQEWKRFEWGWSQDAAAKKWVAYKIIDVKILRVHTMLTQTCEGRPWRIKTEEAYLSETSRLLCALDQGIEVTDRTKTTRSLVAGCWLFKSESAQKKDEQKTKKELKKIQRQQETFYRKIKHGEQRNVCCNDFCMSVFECGQAESRSVNIPLIQYFRNHFLELSHYGKRGFICNRLKSKNEELGIKHTRFYLEPPDTIRYYVMQGAVPLHPACDMLHMLPVCVNFFTWVLQVSKNKVYQPTLKGEPFSVEMNGPRKGNVLIHEHDAADAIEKWLANYAEAHVHDPANPRIILTVGSRQEVYERFESDFREAKEPEDLFFFPKDRHNNYYLPSASYFYRVWKLKMKHIVLRKFLHFSLCDECIRYRDMRQAALSEEERRSIRKQERAHHDFVHAERNTYYFRRLQAQTYPEDYLCATLDGADQCAYGLPHFTEQDKSSSSCRKVPLCLMGGLVHGFRAYGYTYLRNIKHGTNIVIEVLHRIFCDYKEAKGKLPPVCFLQFDNTSKQNKSQYMFGWLSCLVEWGLFREVIVSFLPVGHTHEDIGLV